jgi:hypothetical protein
VRVTQTLQVPSRDLLAYFGVLATGYEPDQFFDVRWAVVTGGMRRRFISAQEVHQAAQLVARLAWQTDVYVGVALRNRRNYGGKSAITGSRLLYIECDHPDSQARLESFPFAPSMMVASGSPGHLHVYWLLHQLATGPQVENANRRLALALEGDPVSVDVARILRPPETMNHKDNPPLPVRLLHLDPNARYTLSDLIAGLPADPQPVLQRTNRASSRRRGRTTLDRALLAIPAAEYVRILTSREPNRAGKILCPFHEESNPSLQLYPDGTFYCYGGNEDRACRKGGTIFDFAAALWLTGQSWDAQLRGRRFIEVRDRLAEIFFGGNAGV